MDIRLLDHAFEEMRDEDLRWADLVMVSAMHAQRADARGDSGAVRARSDGARSSAAPGPAAIRKPCCWKRITCWWAKRKRFSRTSPRRSEQGTARSLYRVADKPDMSRSPIPRFDLLRREKYTSMPVQFSRGCPFQCEFCDIITIYGRRPRAKTSGAD